MLPITRTIFNVSINSQANDKFIDNYPGGISSNALAVSDSDYEANFFFSYGFNFDINLGFDFIPATSALDVGSGNTTLNDSDYYRQYTSANPPTGNRAIPFVNFTTSSNQNNNLNESHISFNRRNGDWLAAELDADATNQYNFDCTAFCTNNDLEGDEYICGSSTYSPPIEATTVNWVVVSGANLVTTTTSGLDITITQTNSNNNGFITLQATYGNPRCGEVTLLKDIWVGTPNVTNYEIYGGNDNVPINSTSQLNVDYADGNEGFYWFITVVNSSCPSGGTQPMFQTGTGTALTLTSTKFNRYAFINWGNCTGEYVINCRAINPCGTQDISYKVVNVFDSNTDPCPDGPYENKQASKEKIKVYPNPVKDGTIHLKLPPPGLPCDDGFRASESTINLVKIFDFSGRELYSKVFETNDITIEKLDFKKGHYVLNVFMYNGEEQKQILVIE